MCVYECVHVCVRVCVCLCKENQRGDIKMKAIEKPIDRFVFVEVWVYCASIVNYLGTDKEL